jgi:Transposase DDE domain
MTWEVTPTGKRGRQRDDSDAAIQTCLTMKVQFGMALRQTTGFVESLFRLIGLEWAVPDFSTISRRQKTLKVNIPYRGSDGALPLLIDGRKIHIGIDEKPLEIRAAEFTTSDIGDALMLPEPPDQIPCLVERGHIRPAQSEVRPKGCALEVLLSLGDHPHAKPGSWQWHLLAERRA